MEKLLHYCENYAKKFSSKSPNLLFMGHTGLGKTHLALAIADAVLGGGHDVLYTSAAALAARLGREHFDFDSGDEWLNACQEADLLILDDLGTEYITPLTISVLYELINTRMLTERPTIYTTNITDQSVFVARYTEKVPAGCWAAAKCSSSSAPTSACNPETKGTASCPAGSGPFLYYTDTKTAKSIAASRGQASRSDGIRTHGLLVPNQARYQLRYTPIKKTAAAELLRCGWG